MYLKIVLSILSINLLSGNAVQCSPLQFFQVHKNRDYVSEHEGINIYQRNKKDIRPYMANDKMLMEKPASMDIFIKEDIESDFFGNVKAADYNKRLRISKRAAPEHQQKKDTEGEGRASIPFISKEGPESENSGGGGSGSALPSVPGLSGVSSAIRDSSSNTPTLVMGGFSFVVMPMPGLSMSNVGNALQTGQQMSQLIPGLPAVPG